MSQSLTIQNTALTSTVTPAPSASILSGANVCADSKKLYDFAENLARARDKAVADQLSARAKDKNNFIKAIAKMLFNRDWKPEIITVESLKRKESAIGASLFYTGKSNERVEFFNDNLRSWFFYQEIVNAAGLAHSTTLHYEVNPQGVLKITNAGGMKCGYIQGQEYDNFMRAASLYYERVMKYIYHQDASLDKVS